MTPIERYMQDCETIDKEYNDALSQIKYNTNYQTPRHELIYPLPITPNELIQQQQELYALKHEVAKLRLKSSIKTLVPRGIYSYRKRPCY